FVRHRWKMCPTWAVPKLYASYPGSGYTRDFEQKENWTRAGFENNGKSSFRAGGIIPGPVSPAPSETTSMATDAQIKANISNATRWTGPKTEQGRRASARNSATRGGVSGTGKALSPAQSDRVQAFKAALIAGNKPHDSYDCLLIEDAAIARALMWECDE